MKTEKRLMRIPVMMMTAEQDPNYRRQLGSRRVVFLPSLLPRAGCKIMLQMRSARAVSKKNRIL